MRPGERQEVSGEIEEGGKGDRADGADQARADNRRDRVRRVVEAVEKIEGQRNDDQADEERKGKLRASVASGVIDNDAVDLVRHILERIRHWLEILEHFASDRELKRIGPRGLERAPQAQRMDLVCLALKAHEPAGQLMRPGAVAR